MYTRPLPWLKTKYAESLQELDKLWYEGLSAKGKKMTRNRLRSASSDRPKPSNAPDYLINDDDNRDDDHSTPNSSFIET